MLGILIGLFCVCGGIYLASLFKLGLLGFIAAIVVGVALAIKAS